MFISHPKPLPLIREGLVASVPLASCALGIMGILGTMWNSYSLFEILGKLSSAIVLWFTHEPNTYCLGLKSRLVAGYVYIPPQTPALDKGGMRGFASSIFTFLPKPLLWQREGLVASVPLASYAQGIMGKLGIVGNTCVICAILGRLSTAQQYG